MRVISPYMMGSQLVRKQQAYTKDDFVKTKMATRIMFLIAFMTILSLIHIWSRVQVVQYGYEINALRMEQHEILEENKKLNMELATLKAPKRIETLSQSRLKMQSVKPEQIKTIEQY